MREQSVQQVVRILPHRLSDDERGIGIDVAKHLDALLLRADEAVAQLRFVRVGADQSVAKRGDGGRELGLHLGLGGPALLVGGSAQVAVGDELDDLAGGTTGRGHGDRREKQGAEVMKSWRILRQD